MFRDVLAGLRERVEGALAVSLIGLDGIAIETVGKGSVPLDVIGAEFGGFVKSIRHANTELDTGDVLAVLAGHRKVHYLSFRGHFGVLTSSSSCGRTAITAGRGSSWRKRKNCFATSWSERNEFELQRDPGAHRQSCRPRHLRHRDRTGRDEGAHRREGRAAARLYLVRHRWRREKRSTRAPGDPGRRTSSVHPRVASRGAEGGRGSGSKSTRPDFADRRHVLPSGQPRGSAVRRRRHRG